MDVISRAKALGASSALALLGPSLLRDFLLAAQRIDSNDLKALNTAIALERAGMKAYTDAVASGLLTTQVLVVTNSFLRDHTAHRDALIAAVQQAGATPTEDTTQITAPTFSNEADVISFAYTVERQAANTYLGLIPTFKSATLGQLSASILGVETTHVALLGQALKKNPVYPDGFVSA